ncbi:hypothetical protein DICVIV_13768, partial [Dictyocaulus viviparus]
IITKLSTVVYGCTSAVKLKDISLWFDMIKHFIPNKTKQFTFAKQHFMCILSNGSDATGCLKEISSSKLNNYYIKDGNNIRKR